MLFSTTMLAKQIGLVAFWQQQWPQKLENNFISSQDETPSPLSPQKILATRRHPLITFYIRKRVKLPIPITLYGGDTWFYIHTVSFWYSTQNHVTFDPEGVTWRYADVQKWQI